ncbi:MAG: PKD-like domain-containing protein, partial [Flavobacteriales bacterium]
MSGTTFSWIAASNASITGESTTAQAGATISDVLVNTTTASSVVNYTVTPTAGTCPGAAINVAVTVNPAPVATATPNPQTICSGSAAGVALTSTVSGTTFSWIAADNISISGESTAAQAGATISDVLVNTTATSSVVNYT